MTETTTTAQPLPPMTVEDINAADEAFKGAMQQPKWNGMFVIVKDAEVVIDKASGIAYCTERAWRALNLAVPAAKSGG